MLCYVQILAGLGEGCWEPGLGYEFETRREWLALHMKTGMGKRWGTDIHAKARCAFASFITLQRKGPFAKYKCMRQIWFGHFECVCMCGVVSSSNEMVVPTS